MKSSVILVTREIYGIFSRLLAHSEWHTQPNPSLRNSYAPLPAAAYTIAKLRAHE